MRIGTEWAWQEGCFGHQLRTDEYGMLSAKTHYIRQNPVSAGLRRERENAPGFFDPCGRKR